MSTESITNFYQFAYQYLVTTANKRKSTITKEIVDLYLSPATMGSKDSDVQTLNDVFRRMLHSAQNRQMSANVIGRSLKVEINGIKTEGVRCLSGILCNFSPKEVWKKYHNRESELLEVIKHEFPDLKDIRDTEHSLWPQYCKTIVSSALFLSQFNNFDEFNKWVNSFYEDNRSMAILPLLISSEVYGLGFALACDFLKELGFVNYGKPDVHIKDILKKYKFIDEKSSNYNTLKTMIKIAKDSNASCYALDKVLWLIGSGRFYKLRDTPWDEDVLIGSMKQDFTNDKKVQKFYKTVAQDIR